MKLVRGTETQGVAGLCLDTKFNSVLKVMMLKFMSRRT